MSPKVKKIKAKINKWDLIKPNSFCRAKETLNKRKRQPTEQEKIFANDRTNNGLIANIYKQLVQLNINKTKKTIKSWQNLIDIFAKRKCRWPTRT